ncbi:hypothetical protein [Runella sp.]|uniref:hypothetical protein n=1 Tax=Runella sp. TaxID=1960881 RepID=UPI003D110A8F
MIPQYIIDIIDNMGHHLLKTPDSRLFITILISAVAKGVHEFDQASISVLLTTKGIGLFSSKWDGLGGLEIGLTPEGKEFFAANKSFAAFCTKKTE